MSYGRTNNYPDYGATDSRYGGSRSIRPQPNSTFDINMYHQLCDNIQCNMFSINNNVTALEKALKEVGTHADTPLLRKKIHETRQGTKEIVSSTTNILKELSSLVATGTRQHKLQAERVRNEFGATVQRYDTLQKQLDPKLKQAVLQNQSTSSNVWNDDEEDQQSLVETERVQQYQIQEELEFEQGLLIERAEKIRQLESDMLDVNVVFRDLAAMVHEQGTVIGTIEENITSAAYNVEDGQEQLFKAANYQKAYRKKLCCFVVILVVVAVIIAIIVSVSLHSS